jgi:hypothetical protein
MSNPIAILPIRLFCDIAARNQALTDLNTGAAPLFYRGDDVEIDIGIGLNGVLLTPTLSNITSVTCQVFRAENDSLAPLMSCTVLAAAMNLALTAVQWTANTTPFFHAAFVFPNAQTAITLGGAASVNYWLRISLLTADATPKVITLAEGPITVLDGPVSATSPGIGTARFTMVAGNWVLQLKNDTDSKWYTVGVENTNGIPTLYLSDTGTLT